jgi:ferrochelatase
MTYGAPRDEGEVADFLMRIRGGRAPEPGLAVEMARRYRAIGGSPLVRITLAQAAALERELGAGFVARAAMRFSEPSVERAVREIADDVDEIVGIVLSPQWSTGLMGPYERALENATAAAAPAMPWRIVRGWHAEPSFIEFLARSLTEALGRQPRRRRMAIVLTAHSLPRRIYDAEPEYVAQLHATAELVARAAGLAPDAWRFAYQSAGHTREEWLRPDLVELFPEIAADGVAGVLVVPVQFLADHLEVLYDLDIAARAQAEAAGLTYERVDMPNDRPDFLRVLASLVRRDRAAAA